MHELELCGQPTKWVSRTQVHRTFQGGQVDTWSVELYYFLEHMLKYSCTDLSEIDFEIIQVGGVKVRCCLLCCPGLGMSETESESKSHSVVPGQNPGVGGHSLLQGIFPTQGLNPSLLHRRRIQRG